MATSAPVDVSKETENFWRSIEILLDEVPLRLRKYFIQKWNEKHPSNVWDNSPISGQSFWQGKDNITKDIFVLAIPVT